MNNYEYLWIHKNEFFYTNNNYTLPNTVCVYTWFNDLQNNCTPVLKTIKTSYVTLKWKINPKTKQKLRENIIIE